MVDITKSESDKVDLPSKQIQDEETDAVAQTKDDFSPVIKLERVGSTSGGVDMLQPCYQSIDVTCITDEETRTTAETLESFREAEDPVVIDGTRTPPGEAAHFEGTGLMDSIRNSARRQEILLSPNHAADGSKYPSQFHYSCSHSAHSMGSGCCRGFNEPPIKIGITQCIGGGCK